MAGKTAESSRMERAAASSGEHKTVSKMSDKAHDDKANDGGETMAAQATADAKADVKDKPETRESKSVPASELLNKINGMSTNERYQIRREISLGGQGTCKVAFDQITEREVVLKVSSPGAWNAEHLIKEARYAAKMNHPNVIRVLDVGAFGKDQVFMAMPYIEGSSLDVVIRKVNDASIPGLMGYSVTAVAELFDHICAGVEHAHSMGVLHLDLKPQNIIVGTKGETVVVDFGVAQPLNPAELPKRHASHEAPASNVQPGLTTTLTGVNADPNMRAVGTPAYMSPEQSLGDPSNFTERTDVYGLGGVLFFLLTGEAPNRIQRPQDLEPYFRHSPVPSPADHTRRRVPPELEALCMKCLARDPQVRFASVFHVRHVLKGWLGSPEMWELYGRSSSF
jgi:eukaryotic-like serine/threonine-protein kinase